MTQYKSSPVAFPLTYHPESGRSYGEPSEPDERVVSSALLDMMRQDSGLPDDADLLTLENGLLGQKQPYQPQDNSSPGSHSSSATEYCPLPPHPAPNFPSPESSMQTVLIHSPDDFINVYDHVQTGMPA